MKQLGTIEGPWALTKNLTGCTPIVKLAAVLSSIVGFLTALATIWFIFQVAIAAVQWVASGGEKAAVQNAQQKLTHSVIGLVISVAGIFIVMLITSLLGIGNILNLPTIIPFISPAGATC